MKKYKMIRGSFLTDEKVDIERKCIKVKGLSGKQGFNIQDSFSQADNEQLEDLNEWMGIELKHRKKLRLRGITKTSAC